MTTLASWVGTDSRGPSSLYLVTDSRITWSPGSFWDSARKTFASQTSPEIFGYAGDVLFPAQTLGQITELIDRGATSQSNISPESRLQWIIESLEASCKTYPYIASGDFTLLYCGRYGEGMTCSFYAFSLEFKKRVLVAQHSIDIPTSSGPLTYSKDEHIALGSGRDGFKKYWEKWKESEVGETSRSVFSAFTDHLKSGDDPLTGGPPQLVGLYRKGSAKSFGVIWNQHRFLGGMEVIAFNDHRELKWHNDLFEICDPLLMHRAIGAQAQPRPRTLKAR